jgi:predicted Zn-dependent protease
VRSTEPRAGISNLSLNSGNVVHPMTSKRLEVLLKMTATGSADSFAWYALALEYKGLGNIDEALATFRNLRAEDADYVPMYLMCGSMLIEAQRHEDAREWLASGLAIAKRKGDTHAAGEIEGALATL